MDKRLQDVVSALRKLFDDEVPQDFSHSGQTFDERCEAWASHAVEQLEAELEEFNERN
jgi:hypothetical protein